MGRKSNALFAVALLSSCAAAKPRYPAELLARTARQFPQLSSGQAEMELVLPFDQLFDSPLKRGAQLGTLKVPSKKFESPVVLEPIGNFSRMMCRYPKLAVSLPGRSGSRTRLFLTPHCADGAQDRGTLPDERHVARHYAAYRLQRALGLPSMRVSLVQVRYRDSNSERSIDDKPALVIEDLGDLNRRLGNPRSALMRAGRLRMRDLDPAAVARFHLFQVLINNPDWRLLDLEPVSNYEREDPPPALHNAAVVQRTGRMVPVAFDFDLSSLSGVPETVRNMTRARYRHFLEEITNPRFLGDEPALLRWMVIRLQHFAQRHRDIIARSAVTHFTDRRSAAIAALAGLPADAAEASRQHVATFFSALERHGRYPRVTKATPLYRDRDRAEMLCERMTPGAPVQLLDQTPSAGLLRVRLIQYAVMSDSGRETIATCLRDGHGVRPDVGWIDARALSSPGGAP